MHIVAARKTTANANAPNVVFMAVPFEFRPHLLNNGSGWFDPFILSYRTFTTLHTDTAGSV